MLAPGNIITCLDYVFVSSVDNLRPLFVSFSCVAVRMIFKIAVGYISTSLFALSNH